MSPRPEAHPEGRATRSVGIVLAALVAALALGCAGRTDDAAVPDEEPPMVDAPAPAPDDDPTGAGDGPAVPAGLEDAVAIATADAAGVAGVMADAVTLVLAEPVTWPDGSLGCPEPDMLYTQALVDGYRIVLEVGGESVAYHGALGSPPFRCEDPALG